MFGQLNSLCAQAMRSITNHAPIGEYRLRFFPREDFNCHAVYTPSNQGDTFSTIVADSTAIGI